MISHPDGSISANPEYVAWMDRDYFLKPCLYASVTSSIFTFIYQLPTSIEIWKAIERCFQSSSRAQIHQLRHRLQNVTKGTKPIQTYINEIKMITIA